MTATHRTKLILQDSLYLTVLVLYILAGVWITPFHGDETTTIHKSRDFYLLMRGAFGELGYQPKPTDPAEQELRLLNGVVSAYSIGSASTAFGFSEQDLPAQWLWGADLKFNRQTGHTAPDAMLFDGRLVTAFLTVISLALLFAFARRISGRRTAYIAALVYTLMPSVLLNGRRAMYEGALLLSVMLVLTTGVAIAYWVRRYTPANRNKLIVAWLLLGIAAGFSMASKHNLIVTIAAVVVPLLILSRRHFLQALSYAVMAGVIAFAVFFALNPAWWSSPLAVPREVLRLRGEMAAGQINAYGGFDQPLDRVIALFSQPFAAPQYYEVQVGWPDWIGDQIGIYERLGLAGISIGTIGVIILAIVTVILLFRARWRSPHYRTFFIVTLVISLIGILIITPLNWQRYYLPLAALFACAIGLAADAAFTAIQRSTLHPKHPTIN